jgi:hypothetical protein
MDEAAKDVARRAGAKLLSEYGPALPAFVEQELQNPSAGPQRYTGVETTIAIASLLVSVAQFAWQVYRDLKKDRAEAVSKEVLARELRLKMEVPPQVTTADRDRLIGIVVEEVLTPPPEA